MTENQLLTINDLDHILDHIGQFDHVSKTQIVEHINTSPFLNKQDILDNHLTFHKDIPTYLKYRYHQLFKNQPSHIIINHMIRDFCEAGSPLKLFHDISGGDDENYNPSRYLYNGFVVTITKLLH